MNAHILINRGGGSAGDRAAIEQAIEEAGIAGTIRWLDGGELCSAAEAAVGDGADIVVAGGGDGTISTVAGALAGSRTKLGVLPLGTLNHFARDLGVPTVLADAARLIATGSERLVDLAEVNGRPFVNNSSIGIYPLMVRDRDAQQEQRGRRKRPAMAIAALRALLRFSSRRLSLTVNDRTAHLETPLLFVGNNAYRVEMPGAGTRKKLDAGELCVLVLRRRSRWGFLAATLRTLLGRDRARDVDRIGDVQHLRVDSRHESLTIAVDGETVRMATPLDYRIRPRSLRVIAP